MPRPSIRRGALLCLALFIGSSLTFAQAVLVRDDSQSPTLTLPFADVQRASLENPAAPSLDRALARAVAEDFSSFDPNHFQNIASAVAAPVNFGSILLAQASPQSSPQGSGQGPTLGDLGFPNEQTKGSAEEQARLDKRSHMLKMHQRVGIITAIPLAGTILVSGLAGGHSTDSTGRNIHAALGTATAGLYLTTAYYSIFAPRIAGTPTRGPIRLHKILAFIHGPGMILTPMLGAIAYQQKSRGERVHGIASAHGAVAGITAISYGLAIASVSFRF